MTGAARISVIMPARNAADTIAGTLQSLGSERSVIAEIVLVDDGSSDATADIATRRASDIGIPIRVVAGRRSGPGAARNTGIDNAVGSRIFFLDADDHLQPGALEVLGAALDRDSAADIAIGASIRRTANRPDKLKAPRGYTGNMLENAERYFRNELWAIAIGSALIRAEAIGGIRFPENIRLDEDTCFWTALLCSHAVTTVDMPVLLYNLDEERMAARYTAQSCTEFLRLAVAYTNLSKYGLRRDVIQWRKAWLAMRMVRQLTMAGDYKAAATLHPIMHAHPDFRGTSRDIRYALRTRLGLLRERLSLAGAGQSRP